jgi:protein involved in polysaccharide export with SLBB domain
MKIPVSDARPAAIGFRARMARVAGVALLAIAGGLCSTTLHAQTQTQQQDVPFSELSSAGNNPQSNPMPVYGAGQPATSETLAPSSATEVPAATNPVSVQIVTGGRMNGGQNEDQAPMLLPVVVKLGDFERYVRARLGVELPRFGASLLKPAVRDFTVPATAAVPGSYELNPGDTVSIHLMGSVKLSSDFQIESDGGVFVPGIGRIALAGVRYDQLHDVVARAAGVRFKNFEAFATIKKLNGIRVYVTGFAANPGAYNLHSLSTLVNATFAAGGPVAGGSFRSVRLYRKNQLVTDFDLYELLRGGDRTHDVILQNEDVLYIPPVGPQVAIAGSVNAEAIYEARPGETLGQLISQYAGGFQALADNLRVMLYRIDDLDREGSQELAVADAMARPVAAGDIVKVLSIGTTRRPVERQAVLVRLEGEVAKPGDYYVAPGAKLGEVLRLAGGLTSRAFVFGTRLERFSVREQQRESFLEGIEQIEIGLAAAPLSGSSLQSENPNRQQQQKAAREVVERMRKKEPDGRVVLPLPFEAQSLPEDFVLENNDRVYVPARPTTVGVFGAVYRSASFELRGDQSIKQYLDAAGGVQPMADKREVFVIHANGAVESARHGALSHRALPGDLVFVPVRSQYESFWAKAANISTVFFNFGLALAAIHAVFP